jgi:hypothetical protein
VRTHLEGTEAVLLLQLWLLPLMMVMVAQLPLLKEAVLLLPLMMVVVSQLPLMKEAVW